MRYISFLLILMNTSVFSYASDKDHWLYRKIEASERYDKYLENTGSWYEKEVLWEMQSKESYKDCEISVTTKYKTFFDIFFKVNSEGKAIDIEWYPDTNDGGCISRFLENYEFPKPPKTMPLWLQMYPGEI